MCAQRFSVISPTVFIFVTFRHMIKYILKPNRLTQVSVANDVLCNNLTFLGDPNFGSNAGLCWNRSNTHVYLKLRLSNNCKRDKLSVTIDDVDTENLLTTFSTPFARCTDDVSHVNIFPVPHKSLLNSTLTLNVHYLMRCAAHSIVQCMPHA